MARGSSSSSAVAKKRRKEKEEEEEEEGKPEVRQRKRLKSLAISNNLVSQVPAKRLTSLSPSEALINHHGRDIVKKSQRKNLRFLFSLPGLLGPIGGGQIGELKDLGTNNPVLYLDFAEGRVKLFGTIVFPTNRYLTMHFPSSKSNSKGANGTGKSVLCDDYFDNMIVFSDAWWIGTKDDNPEETQLDFPKEFTRGQHAEYDFKGGAGSTSVNKQSGYKDETTYVQEPSPNGQVEDKLSDQGNKDLTAATPVRHSARTAGKRFNFGEASSGDDSGDDYVESDT